jgi:hypothetical protein
VEVYGNCGCTTMPSWKGWVGSNWTTALSMSRKEGVFGKRIPSVPGVGSTAPYGRVAGKDSGVWDAVKWFGRGRSCE